MPLKTFDADLSNFDQVFGGFTKSETTEGSPSEPGQLKFLLFLADKDPSTNRSWCPGTLSVALSSFSSLFLLGNDPLRRKALLMGSLSLWTPLFLVTQDSFFKVIIWIYFYWLIFACCLLFDLNAILFVDCNVAEPIIYEKLEASNSNLVLLRAYVGDRPTWRNPSHPWRVDPRFKLKGVPTLIRWENESVAGRLEDYEAHIGDKIDSILASN
ncbi:unnamed protein product [Musa acuminata subsp. burmannicoides]